MSYFIVSFSYPIILIGGSILLFLRLGWPGLIVVLTSVAIIPVLYGIAKVNGSIVEDINL